MEDVNWEKISKIAAAEGAKAALNHIEKRKKTAHDRKLYNTRLLLENYPYLRAHCEKSISSLKNVKRKNAADLLDELDACNQDINIESIKKSSLRTYVIINHIDEMLDLFKIFCEKTKNLRKYNVAVKYYFEGKTTEEIRAELEPDAPTKRTIQRDLNFAVGKLSSLIFGIDGLSTAK